MTRSIDSFVTARLRATLARRIFYCGDLLWLAILIPAISGVVRYYLGCSLPLSRLCAVALALAVWPLRLVWALEHGRHSRRSLLSLALFCVGLTAAVYALYDPRFRGLPSSGGIDAALNIDVERQFVGTDPRAYAGMTVFPALLSAFEVALGGDLFVAFRAIFYVVVALLMSFVVAQLPPASASRTERWTAAAALIYAVHWIGYLVILPIVGYLQADGFYAQLLSLVPLLLAILLYAQAPTAVWRLLALGAGALVLRHTYGLNLGDYLIACAIALVVEAAGSDLAGAMRRVYWLAAIIALATAALVYREVTGSLSTLTGGFIRAATLPLASATAAMGALAALLPMAIRRAGFPMPAATARAGGLGGSFALTAGLAQCAYAASGHPRNYYFLKFGLVPAVVAALSLAPVASVAFGRIAAITRRHPRLLWRALASSTAMAALSVWAVAAASSSLGSYRWIARQRLNRAQVPVDLSPLANETRWHEIRRVLQRTGKEFGGSFLPHYMENEFTNTALGSATIRASAYSGTLVPEGGRCYFWTRTDPALTATSIARAELVARLDANPGAQCGPAVASDWLPPAPFCHLCLDARRRALPLTASSTVWYGGVYELEGTMTSPFRWTDGHAKIELANLAATDAGCELRVELDAPSNYSLFFDNEEMAAPKGRVRLPAFDAGTHVLTIDSPTFVPADHQAGGDQRRLGVRLLGLSLTCLTADDRAGNGRR